MNKQIEALKIHAEKYGLTLEQFRMMCEGAYKVYEGQGLNSVDYALAREAYLAGFTHACKEALAEAEKQEPVAWMRRKYDSGTNPVAVEWDYSDIQIFKHDIPLYTHPNQELLNEYWEMGYNQCLETNKKFPIPATWQSLSDDEILNIYEDMHRKPRKDGYEWDYARAIEQALKEKNHA